MRKGKECRFSSPIPCLLKNYGNKQLQLTASRTSESAPWELKDPLQLRFLTQELEIASRSPNISFPQHMKKRVTINPDTTADVLSGERLISFIGPVFSLGFTLTL